MNNATPTPSSQASTDPEQDWVRYLHVQAEVLDGIEVAMCAFDLADCAVAWNRTFLRLFPEHDGHITRGEHYSVNLRRFYETRLDASEMGEVERYIEAGVARHQQQAQPFEFDHRGQRVQVSSLQQPGLGRIRVWRTLAPLAESSAVTGFATGLGHELLEYVPDALVVCDRDGAIAWANANFFALFQLQDRARVLGSTVESLYVGAWGGASAADLARRDQGLRTLKENLRFAGAPFELALPGGACCRVIARPARDGAMFYAFVDISALKRYEAALQLTLDSAARGIIRYDASGRILLFNRQARELLELPEDLLNGRHSIGDVVRFQQERGDVDAIELAGGAQDSLPSDIYSNGKYLRRTHNGRVLEVVTLALAEGGAVRTYSDVTAYFEAQQALSEKTHALEITLDSMSQGISAIDRDGRLVFWNRRYQELLQLPASLLAGKPTMDQLVRFQIDRGDFGPDFSYVDAVTRGYVARGDRLSALTGPETYVRKTRDGRTFDVTTRPLPDGGVVRTFTDLSAYVASQAALARKEAQLSALVNNLPDRVWLKDQDGAFVLSNPAHRKYHGVTEPQVLGRTGVELFGEEKGARQAVSDEQALRSQQPVAFEQFEFGPDGELRCSEVVKVAMRDEEGRCVGLLGIARDITRRKQEEAALIAAKEEALLASGAKSRFLSSMSHEIRTPMNAILGMLTLLRGTELTARQDDYAGKAEGAARSLLSLLNDILDFSKIEAGKMRLDMHPFSLEGLLSDLSVILSSNLGQRDVEVLYDLDPQVPDHLVGDDMRLRQILINLGGNAIKFTERGEVVVGTRLVERDATHATIEFSVQDSGIGITPEQQQRLFGEFVQASDETARQYGGTGLGLGICRRLTELMDSRLHLASALSKGSRFWFTLRLPVSAVVADPVDMQEARVLIVDDNAMARDTLAALCRGCGWQVDTAATGREALTRITASAAAGLSYQAVFVDWIMPELDGWQTCARIRALSLPEDTPLVIMVTAHGREMLDQRAASEQALLQGYLVKPVTAGMLRSALARARHPGEPSPAPRLVAPSQGLAGMRLLLAEDNLVNQQIAIELLERSGAAVEVVVNGQLAVERLAGGGRFDAVLMDVQMPVMDGLAATREIRKAIGPADLPIIAMTANAMESDRQDCLAAGMNDHVGKPFVIEEVVRTVRRHVLPDEDSAWAPVSPVPDRATGTFDRRIALERLGNDEGLLRSVLPVFRDNLQGALATLASATATPEDLARLMHSLKGMSANVGAEGLAGDAARLEECLRRGGGAGGREAQSVAEAIRGILVATERW
ncbi:response regulator [Ramlibacter sp. G-1-2-2]|uniref:Virulence sensor protein BvgS n=1 Tax=Ramlibacter agri TaxID=2728837 RepID=A0A848GX73_9BURK|nr:PAS-domain containing protein [Ramlibacter agri]NML43195.1 response regulator [Ramlibacter agri]